MQKQNLIGAILVLLFTLILISIVAGIVIIKNNTSISQRETYAFHVNGIEDADKVIGHVGDLDELDYWKKFPVPRLDTDNPPKSASWYEKEIFDEGDTDSLGGNVWNYDNGDITFEDGYVWVQFAAGDNGEISWMHRDFMLLIEF